MTIIQLLLHHPLPASFLPHFSSSSSFPSSSSSSPSSSPSLLLPPPSFGLGLAFCSNLRVFSIHKSSLFLRLPDSSMALIIRNPDKTETFLRKASFLLHNKLSNDFDLAVNFKYDSEDDRPYRMTVGGLLRKWDNVFIRGKVNLKEILPPPSLPNPTFSFLPPSPPLPPYPPPSSLIPLPSFLLLPPPFSILLLPSPSPSLPFFLLLK